MPPPSLNTGASSSASVQVVVRLRPMNEREQKEGTLPVISASTASKCVTVIKGVGQKQARSQFQFDNVFGSFSTQVDIFGATLQPVIRDVLKGYETCVFAYGQTGTGKTHTMEGKLDDPDEFGVIPRSARAIFDAIDKPQYTEARVSCSYLEIYNEDLSDLLSNNREQRLDIMNNGKGVTCRGLSERQVDSAKDVLKLMQSALQARRVGETRMNKQSSRSHCIFTIRVAITEMLSNGSIMEYQGKLHCVDLAGSESAKTAELKQSSAEAQATREQERRNINKSLLTLGRVITALKDQSEGKRNPIPYRDSKLTRILQEALGGRCKTVVIATISPSVMNLQESLQTLHYAQKANGIQNKPVSSSYMSVSAICSTPTKSSDRNAMPAERWNEMEIRMEHMQHEVEEARQALARNYMQHQDLKDRAEQAEAKYQDLNEEVESMRSDLKKAQDDLVVANTEKKKVESELNDTRTSLTKTLAVLDATQTTESNLTREARALLGHLKTSMADGDCLHGVLRVLRDEEKQRKASTRKYCTIVEKALHAAIQNLKEVDDAEKENLRAGKQSDDGMYNQTKVAVGNAKQLLAAVAQRMRALSSDTDRLMKDTMHDKLNSFQADTDALMADVSTAVTDGEQQLAKSCAATRDSIKEFDCQITELHKTHDAQYQKASQIVEELSQHIRSQVLTVVDNTTQLLDQATRKNDETRTVLAEFLGAWHATGVESTSGIGKIVGNQLEIIDAKHELMAKESKRHGVLNRQLEQQGELLAQTQSKQQEQFESQTVTLAGQKEHIEQAQQKHDQMCNSMIETIMAGVNKLVVDQVSLVMKQQSEQSQGMIQRNQEAESMNVQIQHAAKSSFEAMHKHNAESQTEATALDQMSRDVMSGLEQSRKYGATLQQHNAEYQTKNDEYAVSARTKIDELAGISGEIDDVRINLAGDGQQTIVQSIGKSKDGVTAEIGQMNDAAKQLSSYAQQTVLPSFTESIQGIEDPREAIMTTFSDKLGKLKELSNSTSTELHGLANDQLQAVSGMAQSVEADGAEFRTLATASMDEAEQLRVASNSRMAKHLRTTRSKLDECKKRVDTSNTQSAEFGNDVIGMNDESKPLPQRLQIDYSNDLSATASEAEILKNLSADGMKLHNGGGGMSIRQLVLNLGDLKRSLESNGEEQHADAECNGFGNAKTPSTEVRTKSGRIPLLKSQVGNLPTANKMSDVPRKRRKGEKSRFEQKRSKTW